MIPVNESTIRLAAFLGVLLLMLGWQLLADRKPVETENYWPSRLNNLGLAVVNVACLRLLVPLSAVAAAEWSMAQELGLFASSEAWTNLALGVILLDMAIYWQHRLMHRIPLLWRLHRVHHCDTAVDVTTALRFHPLEMLLSMAYKLLLVLALGLHPFTVIVFELLLNLSAMFNHSNIRLPLDRWVRVLLVTPDMHRVHHSVYTEETNSNYGFFLPLWDRIFKSYIAQPRDGHLEMRLGLNYFRNNDSQRLGPLLTQPFKREANS
ncbi:MAG: sterol desaturase/sphingolipid hydroxylase (fatty acid hydroxylase superfamily) [Gammaproteobacteria bacterium]|jgi:sterol desaturase/sphingolipid hydroxylase (fatty acid hydroxylase superfamily)